MLGHGLFHWFEMAVPILLVEWIQTFSTPVDVIGVIVAVGFAPIGLTALPGGLLVDKYGSNTVLLLSILGMSFGFAILALAPSILAVGVGLAVWGLFAGIYHPGGMSLISTGASHRGTVFAYHGMAGNIGTALGPFVTASLLLVFEWRLVVMLLIIPGIFAFLYGLSTDFNEKGGVDSRSGASKSDRGPLHLRKNATDLLYSLFPVVLVIVAFDGLFYRGFTTFLPQILRELPAMQSIALTDALVGINVGDYIFVGVLVIGIVGQWAGGTLTEKISTEKGLTAGFSALGLLSLAFVVALPSGFRAIVLLTGLIGFFLFFVQPMYQVAVAVYTPAETRGLSYGLTYLAEFGVGAGSIALGGFLLETYPTPSFFLTMSVFAFGAAVLALWLLIKPSN